MLCRVNSSSVLRESCRNISRSTGSNFLGGNHGVLLTLRTPKAAQRCFSDRKASKHAPPSINFESARLHNRQLHDTQVLYQDAHCLVINKPAGLLALPDLTEGPSLLRLAESYLIKSKKKRAGRSFVATELEPDFLGPSHRLDAPVSGCMLFAKSPEAAKHFAAHFRRKRVPSSTASALRKKYLCVVAGVPQQASGRLQHWLDRSEDTRVARRVRVRNSVDGDWAVAAAQPPRKSSDGAFASVAAALDYEVRAAAPNRGLALLEVTLLTGRRHQIRAQLAHVGLPVLGDQVYFTDADGKTSSFGDAKAAGAAFAAHNSIALHAASLSFPRLGSHGHDQSLPSGFSYSLASGQVCVRAPVPKLWRRTLGNDFSSVVQKAMSTLEPAECDFVC